MVGLSRGRQLKERKKRELVIDHVLHATEAGNQLSLLVGPDEALDLKLSKEVGLFRLRLLLSHLETLRLLHQLHDQSVMLLGKFAALCLLDAQHGVGFAQLLLQGGIGLCKKERRKSISQKAKRDAVAGEIRPDCSAVGPNLGDYSPRVR